MKFNRRRLKMTRFTFSAFLVTAGLAGILQNANGQATNATMQTTGVRVAPNRSASGAKPVVTARPAPRPAGVRPQTFNGNPPRTVAQPPPYLRRTYSPAVRNVNPGPATLNTQRGPVQQSISI